VWAQSTSGTLSIRYFLMNLRECPVSVDQALLKSGPQHIVPVLKRRIPRSVRRNQGLVSRYCSAGQELAMATDNRRISRLC